LNNKPSLLTQAENNTDFIVGIVVALPEELATLTPQRLQRGESCRVGRAEIAYSGAGVDNAKAAAKKLIANGARLLVSWGCSAGLGPDIKPGDLVIASQVLNSEHCFDTDMPMQTELQRIFSDCLTVHTGKMYSSDKLIGLSPDKHRIHADFHAIALDMESIAIAEASNDAQLAFAVIRSIADPVTMDLPQAVAKALNNHGEVSLAKLLGHLCWHPWEVVPLIKLGTHFKAAQKTLKIVARELQHKPMHLPWLAH